MKKIYFVRHAITDAHIGARKKSVLGFRDLGLNKKGIEDSYLIVDKLRGIHIDGILSSDYKSAIETTDILNTYFKVPVYYSDLLRERNQGEYQGRELKELYLENKEFSITTEGKGRESLRDFMDRTKEGFEFIVSSFPWETCIVVSHKGFLQTMMATCLKKKPTNWYLCEIRVAELVDGKWIYTSTIR